MEAVLLHCQTIAGHTGFPVSFSQATVVSLWLVIPIPDISSALTLPCLKASSIVLKVVLTGDNTA